MIETLSSDTSRGHSMVDPRKAASGLPTEAGNGPR